MQPILLNMRISGSSDQALQAVLAARQAQAPDAVKQNYQISVLKKSLDSQSEAASKLLDLLEPKGRVLDIRA
jgi:hypothetical protein